MKRIDSHQHFWQYNPAEHTWMTDTMQVLKQDFMPTDLSPLLNQIGFDECIAVQARQSIEETNWLLKLANENDFIKGVVGWVDLRSHNIYKVLSSYCNEKKLIGVRHVVHDEADDKFMLQPAFQNGITALKEFNLNYTIFRFFNTYGPKQSTDFVISKFIKLALKHEPVPMYGNGLQTRTFCYVDDNVSCVVKILEEGLMINDVINVGNESNVTILQLAELIIRLTGSKSKIEFAPPLKEGDMSRRQPDASKMMKILNTDLISLEEGIKRILKSPMLFLKQ